MKYLPAIAGALLGLLFIASGITVLLHLVPMPPPPVATAAMFFDVFGSTGWLTFIKVLEVLGGVLTAIPHTRNFGLLILGPIIVNILAFHTFVMKGVGLGNPMIIVIVLLALFLLWADRRRWLGLAGE